jgi:hypothetical protein
MANGGHGAADKRRSAAQSRRSLSFWRQSSCPVRTAGIGRGVRWYMSACGGIVTQSATRLATLAEPRRSPRMT